MFYKYFFCFSLLVLLSLLVPHQASAHAGGGPPFLQVNGTFAQTDPYYQGESYLNIPQDIGPASYAPNQQLTFSIITSQLLVPLDIANASTFKWSFGSGDNYEQIEPEHPEGKTIQHSYTTPGSYLVSVEVKAPGDDQFQLIDTVQINIVPHPGYVVPKVAAHIGADNFRSGDTFQFSSIPTFDPSVKHPQYFWDFADSQLTKGKQVVHPYSDDNTLSYIYHRVIDDNGLKADIGWNVRILSGSVQFPPFGNMKSAPVTTGPPETTASTSSAPTKITIPFFAIIAAVIILGILFTSIMLIFKGKSK